MIRIDECQIRFPRPGQSASLRTPSITCWKSNVSASEVLHVASKAPLLARLLSLGCFIALSRPIHANLPQAHTIRPTCAARCQLKEKYCRPKKTTFSAPLLGPLGRSPPKWESQCPEQTSDPLQNFSQIRSAISEEMRPEQTDRHTQTANLGQFLVSGAVAYLGFQEGKGEAPRREWGVVRELGPSQKQNHLLSSKW